MFLVGLGVLIGYLVFFNVLAGKPEVGVIDIPRVTLDRSTEGGCDRTSAVQALSDFAGRYGALATSVRGLPPAALLRPLVELLVEAVESEDGAMRRLRDSWVPFDTTVYEAYDGEVNDAKRLRRQVASGLTSLLADHQIAPGEIT